MADSPPQRPRKTRRSDKRETVMQSSSTENLNRTPNEESSEGIIDLMDVPDTPMNAPSASASGSASGFASARAVDLTNSDDEEEEEDRKLPARDMDTNITDNEWSCPRCTLINKNTNPRCDACQYVNADIRNRYSSTTRDTQESPAQHQQQRSVSSPMGYIGSGALFGAAVGMTGNWMQGRNVISGALEGGTTGAMGGALLHEVLQNNPREARREMPRTQADRDRYTTRDVNTTPIQPFRYPSHEAGGTISSRNSSSNNRNSSSGSYRNGAYVRSSAAAGAVEYSTVDRSYTNTNVDNPMYDIGAAGRSYRSRPRYVTRSQIGMLNDFRDSNGSILRGHDANQDLIAILQNRNNLLRERMHALERASALRAQQFSGMRQGDNIDSMNYEQLLHAFGDGTENMGADEREIGRLPTHTVGDQPLPEDSRQCPICLEDFQKGESRTILPCLHGFHKDCCHKWLKTNGKCPICKHPISSNGG